MSGELSNYAEDGLLEHLLKGTAFPFAAQVRYFGIHVGDPTDTGAGGAEASGGTYARVQILGTGWNTASGRAITNNGDYAFAEMTTQITGATHWTLWDASSAGNYLGKAAIPGGPVDFEIGSTPTIPDGTFSIGWNSGGLSDFAANALCGHLALKAEYDPSLTGLFAFLSEGNPGDSFSGIQEPSGNGYARPDVTSSFLPVSGGATDNDVLIQFNKATGDWRSGNTLTHAGLYDAITAGNPLVYFALTTGVAINANERPQFAIGDFNFTID